MSSREGQSANTKDPVKVVVLANGLRQAPSPVSALLGGGGDRGALDLESESVLLAQQRGFHYTIVKVGSIVPDGAPCTPESSLVRREREAWRSADAAAPTATAATGTSMRTHRSRSILISTSRVDKTEFTRIGAAVDAMLRSATIPPLGNASFAIVSAPLEKGTETDADSSGSPTPEDWDDELRKLSGPELARVPLLYSSPRQALIKAGGVLARLAQPGGGLVTPIEVERFENGFRAVFRPRASSYRSSREERVETQQQASAVEGRSSKYLSPEDEVEQRARREDRAPPAVVRVPAPEAKLEGGVDVVVEERPRPLVRISRCLVGPRTVVKEESESLLVQSLLRALQVLEKDYRLLIARGLVELSPPPST